MRPVLLPSWLSIADADAVTELRVLAREERDDWLRQQRAPYEQLPARPATRPSPRRACSPAKDGSCSPVAISLPGAARREHDREDQVARTTVRRRLLRHPPRTTCAQPAVSASVPDCYPTGA